MDTRFFQEYELSCGQCPWSVAEDHQYNGTPLPPYEPVEDVYAGSHQLVERLRNEIDLFDSVGGYEPDKWPTVISNLYLLADLAIAAAGHIRRHLDAWEIEEAEFQALRQRWQNDQLIEAKG
jgi:hypothetical protein